MFNTIGIDDQILLFTLLDLTHVGAILENKTHVHHVNGPKEAAL
jgi:hypothetical protein